MAYGAIDLHSRQSQVRIVTETGEVVDRRIPTTRDHFTHLFPPDRPMRVLLEASTESEWVAQCLEMSGHEVIVADPNYAPMSGHRTRRIKTDRRDVAALAEACRQEIYRPAHRPSAAQRAVRRHLHVRRQLVRSRSRAISVLRTMLRGEGLRLPGGVAETVPTRLATLVLPRPLLISRDTKITERFTRVSDTELFYRFTVEDDTLYTEPWSGELSLTRYEVPIYEYACHEGNYSLSNALLGGRATTVTDGERDSDRRQ